MKDNETPQARKKTSTKELLGFKSKVANEIRKYDWNHDFAIRVAKCESGLRPNAHNYNPATGDDSWGVFQINRYGRLKYGRPEPDKLVNYKFNIKYAYEMYCSQGWKPWSCAR